MTYATRRTTRAGAALALAAGLLVAAAPPSSAAARSSNAPVRSSNASARSSNAPVRSSNASVREQREIALVREVFQKVFTEHRLDLAGRYIRADYIQHTPTVPQGLAGFEAFYGGFFFPAFPDVTATIDVITAQNGMVSSQATWRGHQAGTGKELVLHTADLYRIQGGKLAEHWDVIDYTPLKAFGIDPARDDEPAGPIDRTGSPAERRNLRLIERFIDDIFQHRRLELSARYVAEDIVQHDPNIASGLDGFIACLSTDFAAFPDLTFTITHIVSGPRRVTVFWVWHGHSAQTGQAFKLTSADSYLIEHGKVVDHWDVGDTIFPAP
jgi:predicted SnoaL-like aldol condensation-catalyzing enzyme